MAGKGWLDRRDVRSRDRGGLPRSRVRHARGCAVWDDRLRARVRPGRSGGRRRRLGDRGRGGTSGQDAGRDAWGGRQHDLPYYPLLTYL